MDTLTLVMLLFVIVEGAQLFAIRHLVKQIYGRVDNLIPEGTEAGDLLTNSFISLAERLTEVDKNGNYTKEAVRAQNAIGGLFSFAAGVAMERIGMPGGLDRQKLPKKAQTYLAYGDMAVGLIERIKGGLVKKAEDKVEEAIVGWGK